MSETNLKNRPRIIAGAMSGTSADGVDVAIVAIDGHGMAARPQLLSHTHHPFSDNLRSRIMQIRRDGQGTLAAMAEITRDVSLAYGTAVQATRGDWMLDAIAAHGQTMFHNPPNTMQWFDPSLVAAMTDCTVISDFRRADCAAGGQGAPLVPFADYVLFRHPTRSRVLLNIGGIANLTYLDAGGDLDSLLAFDTGPGNCVSDQLHPPFDPDGEMAAKGAVLPHVLRRCLEAEYFRRSPPKSTDGPAMIQIFQQASSGSPACACGALNCSDDQLADCLMTACHMTATTIADAIKRYCRPLVDELIVSGGGTSNATMMRLLREQLGDLSVMTTDALNVPSRAKEAMAFAILGAGPRSTACRAMYPLAPARLGVSCSDRSRRSRVSLCLIAVKPDDAVRTHTPSPGTPGEGGGAGDFKLRIPIRHSKSPSPQPSPGVPGEGAR